MGFPAKPEPPSGRLNDCEPARVERMTEHWLLATDDVTRPQNVLRRMFTVMEADAKYTTTFPATTKRPHQRLIRAFCRTSNDRMTNPPDLANKDGAPSIVDHISWTIDKRGEAT